MQGAYPVFQQTDVKRAFNVACAAFQGRFLQNGDAVLVRDGVSVSSEAFVERRGPCMAPNCCLAGSVSRAACAVWSGVSLEQWVLVKPLQELVQLVKRRGGRVGCGSARHASQPGTMEPRTGIESC